MLLASGCHWTVTRDHFRGHFWVNTRWKEHSKHRTKELANKLWYTFAEVINTSSIGSINKRRFTCSFWSWIWNKLYSWSAEMNLNGELNDLRFDERSLSNCVTSLKKRFRTHNWIARGTFSRRKPSFTDFDPLNSARPQTRKPNLRDILQDF